MSGSAVSELLRVAWRTVTAIVERVVADALSGADRLDGVTRIGIDEIAHRKGHNYLTAVTDHDTGRLIWAAPGRDSATVCSVRAQAVSTRRSEHMHIGWKSLLSVVKPHLAAGSSLRTDAGGPLSGMTVVNGRLGAPRR